MKYNPNLNFSETTQEPGHFRFTTINSENGFKDLQIKPKITMIDKENEKNYNLSNVENKYSLNSVYIPMDHHSEIIET